MRRNTTPRNVADIHLVLLFGILALIHIWPARVLAQVQTEKGEVVATCGITTKKGEPISFNANGSLQTRHAGYFEGKEGKTYTLMFRDDKARKALLKCKGRIAWDEEGRITERKDNFLMIMTEANNGHWYQIASAELQQGILSFTAEEGMYTDFSERKATISTKRKQVLLFVDQQGHLLGEPSFIITSFSPSFDASGTISKDIRNCKFEKK
jgi:hypothetical protein